MRVCLLLLAFFALSATASEFYIGKITKGEFVEAPSAYKRYTLKLDPKFAPDSTTTSLDFEEHNVMNIDVLDVGTTVLVEFDKGRGNILAMDKLFDYVATRNVLMDMFSTDLSHQLTKHKHRLRGYVITNISTQHGRWNLELDRHTSTGETGELLVRTYARRTLARFHQHLPDNFEMSIKVYFPLGNAVPVE